MLVIKISIRDDYFLLFRTSLKFTSLFFSVCFTGFFLLFVSFNPNPNLIFFDLKIFEKRKNDHFGEIIINTNKCCTILPFTINL